MVAAEHKTKVNEILGTVCDPEVPVLTILDLGIVREVLVQEKMVAIKLSTTYTGCRAMDTIAADITSALSIEGYESKIELVLAPAWTTDDISAAGKEKLVAYGIAAPLGAQADKSALLDGEKLVPCPQCKSTRTKMISQFGSTACKALFQCEDCLEPFDYFKCLK